MIKVIKLQTETPRAVRHGVFVYRSDDAIHSDTVQFEEIMKYI